MTVTLDLAPEIEQGLQAQARERGLSLRDFLQEIVMLQARVAETTTDSGKSHVERLSGEEWVAEFEIWADSFPEAPPIPDEALRRENLYPDRF